MNRLERLYAINEEIRRRAPRPVSAARLAREFDVSRRTIERDLASLRSAGVALYAERGRAGGQRSIDRSGEVVLTLSTSEVTALMVSLAAGGPDLPFSEAGATASKRLLDGLPASTRIAVDSLRARIRTTAPPSTSTPSTSTDAPTNMAAPVSHRQVVGVRVKRTVEDAVRRQVIINMDYVDRAGNETSRSVEAHGFYHGGDGWYLIGWCLLRDGGRIFRLDRIRSARLTKRENPPRDLDETLGWVPNETATP